MGAKLFAVHVGYVRVMVSPDAIRDGRHRWACEVDLDERIIWVDPAVAAADLPAVIAQGLARLCAGLAAPP